MPDSAEAILVLGAGVIGLSIALEVRQAGYRVIVVAKDLPGDLESTGFASPWAGANWSSFATTENERRRDTVTFHHLEKITKTHPDLVRPTKSLYVWNKEGAYEMQWYKHLTPNYRYLTQDELPRGFTHGIGFDTFTINAPLYLQHLASKLSTLGVPIVRQRVCSLDEAFNLPQIGPLNLVINATGLGARSLLGVEDLKVFPVRGQTVLVRAPTVCLNINDKDPHAEPYDKCYIIPRPGTDGHVVLGGVQQAHRWDTQPDPTTATAILERALRVCPELSRDGSINGLDIISHNVGLRPMRDGGMRLELESRYVGSNTGAGLCPARQRTQSKRRVAVVHAYGLGPAGYQASKGVAEEVTAIVDLHLQKHPGLARL